MPIVNPGQDVQRQVADSLDAPVELLPHLAFLLADLEDIGGNEEEIAGLIRPLALPPGTRALDLGCGKGGVALGLAREFGLDVTGVDAYAPFIEEANRRRAADGLERQCRFECADLHAAPVAGGVFDIVLAIAVRPAFRDLGHLVETVRARTRPGGYMVIDDAYAETTAELADGRFGQYLGRAETLATLTGCGDALLNEIAPAAAAVDALLVRQFAQLERRAGMLTQAHPHLEAMLRAYLAGQAEERTACGTGLRYATWLLRRAM